MRRPLRVSGACLLAVVLFVPAGVAAQITDAQTGCTILERVQASLDADVIIEITAWSRGSDGWTYEIETSSGEQLIISMDGAIIRQTREPVEHSRKQLERLAIRRALEQGAIPSLCALIEEHFAERPGSALVHISYEYEHGEFESELSYWPDSDD